VIRNTAGWRADDGVAFGARDENRIRR
jgi:hypothetical protein